MNTSKVLAAISFVILILCVSITGSQPVFDTVCSDFDNVALTLSTSCTATGTNRSAFICVAWRSTTPGEQDSSASYGAIGATLIARLAPGDAGYGAALYRVPSEPPTSSQTVTVNFTGFVQGAFGVMTFTNTHQSAPLGTAVTASGTGTTASINVASAANELIADCLMYLDPNPVTATSPQSVKWSHASDLGGLEVFGASSTKAGAASVNMSWTNVNSNEWVLIGVPIKPVAVATARKRGVYAYP